MKERESKPAGETFAVPGSEIVQRKFHQARKVKRGKDFGLALGHGKRCVMLPGER